MTVHPTAFVHPQAHVEGASVGAGTRIWQFASVIRGTVLGMDCNVGSSATLDGPQIGNRCLISPGVDIGIGFLIEDDVFIGPNVVLCNDAWPEANKDGFDTGVFRDGAWSVIVRRGAAIGANAVLLPGVEIGAGSLVAAGAVVERSVPAGSLFRRNGFVSELPSDRRCRRIRTVIDKTPFTTACDEGTARC